MRAYKIPLLAIGMLLLPTLAPAQVPELVPLNLATRYDVDVGGMAIGRLRIYATEDNFTYRLKIDTKTSGLIDIFAPLTSVASAHGRRTAEGQYMPQLYSSTAERDGNEKGRRVRIVYDEHGTITERERVPNQDPTYRPVVPITQASAAADPITGFFLLRKKLRDAMERNEREVQIETYDAARLATMTLRVVSRARIELNGKYVDAINTVITRQPVAGYTRKELKKFKEGDPVVHLYFSPDERLIPLMVTVALPFGTMRATLVENKPQAR